MNKAYLSAKGYLELGMAEEARNEFLTIGPEDEAYVSARSQLILLSSHLDPVAMNGGAEEGLRLIRSRPEIVRSDLINNTALCLHFAGRNLEAFELTKEFASILEWTPGDFYGLSCYAARIGEFEEAAQNLVEGMGGGMCSDYFHMFMDLDLEPLYRHAAEEEMKIETAVCLANPRLKAALTALENYEDIIDVMLLREMPQKFQRAFRQNQKTGHYCLDFNAPEILRCEIKDWLTAARSRITTLARRGIAKARTMVMDAQFDFAVAAAKRGDFLAARYHAILGFSVRPETFARFDSRLSPLGMGYFFDDIRHAWREDPIFRELVRAATPYETKSPADQIECLEDCGQLAKETTFWILLRSTVARSIDSPTEAKYWNIEVIRRWPDDPSAFNNLLHIYEKEEAWDAAALVLANVPPSFDLLRAAETHAESITKRQPSKFPAYTHFYGQPDLGRIVIQSPFNGTMAERDVKGGASSVG